MIIPGKTAVLRGIICGLHEVAVQPQPCGVDLTLRRVLEWTSGSSLAFDNAHSRGSITTELPFSRDSAITRLQPGSFLLDFNKIVAMLLDMMGQIFARSSLWRSGALISAEMMDSGMLALLGRCCRSLTVMALFCIRMRGWRKRYFTR
jgi:dUTP pyrophosphatase